MNNSKILVATVATKHGVQDKVKMIIDISEEGLRDAIKANALTDKDGNSISFSAPSFYKGRCLVAFAGCTPENFKSKYKGFQLFVDRSFFGDDVIAIDYSGLQVIVDGNVYGRFVGVMQSEGGDLAEIYCDKIKDIEYFLMNDVNFPEVNWDSKTIVLVKPEVDNAF